jgi:ABC-2 type transport system ATP-binding protein
VVAVSLKKKQRLGFMPDFFGTYQNVDVHEYLDFFARAYGLRGTERRQAIDYVMDFTQLDRLARKPIDGLSKGMKQRLCLGRTMIHDPSVLVLDEPAAGLDPRARIELREMIGRLADDGKAILISSHILTELAEICHRVGILDQGRLLAIGTVEEISARVQDCGQVRVRALEGREQLVRWLEARTDVSDIRGESELITFNHVGDRVSEAAILRDIVQAGFAVVEYGTRHKSLEDVFLHVTEGRSE